MSVAFTVPALVRLADRGTETIDTG